MNTLIILSEAMTWPDAFAAVGIPLAMLFGMAAIIWAMGR
jgi:hypothetical protein